MTNWLRKCRRICSAVLVMTLVLSGILPTANTFVVLAEDGKGIIHFSTQIEGADVYIDNVRQPFVTPYTAEVPVGSHQIAFQIKGYSTFEKTITVNTGESQTVIGELMPELPEVTDESTITVNSTQDNTPSQNLTVQELRLQTSITLRDAVTAILNEESSLHYQIDFDSSISSVQVDEPIDINKRGHLAINGDIDNDGMPNVSIDKSDSYTHWLGCLNVIASDTYISGLKFINLEEQKTSYLSLRVPDDSSEAFQIDGIYILGCEFNNVTEVGLATCGMYGYAASTYGAVGTTNFSNITFSGNSFNDTLLFSFAGAGDEDYNIIDNYTIMANQFVNCGMGMLAGDANTQYVYGDTLAGNGGVSGQAAFSEYNILRNVLVSGNRITMDSNARYSHENIISISASNLGNSHNVTENVTVRNNISRILGGENNNNATVTIANAILGEPDRVLSTYTSDNSLRNVTVEYNDFQTGADREFQVINVMTTQDQKGHGEGHGNVMENVRVQHNRLDVPAGTAILNYRGPSRSVKAYDNQMKNIYFDSNEVVSASESQFSSKTGVVISNAWISNQHGSPVVSKPDYRGTMSNIYVNSNQISAFQNGIAASGSMGDYVDGLGIDSLEIKDNRITTAGDNGKFAIIIAGSAFGTNGDGSTAPYQPGSTNCYIKNAAVSGNIIKAKGGVVAAGGVYDMASRAESIAGNYVDEVTIQDNTLNFLTEGSGEKEFPPVLVADIVDYWGRLVNASPEMNNNHAGNISLGNNTADFTTALLNLTEAPRTYKKSEGGSAQGIIRSLKALTDKAYGVDSYEWSFVSEFNENVSGDHILMGRKAMGLGVDHMYYQVTWDATPGAVVEPAPEPEPIKPVLSGTAEIYGSYVFGNVLTATTDGLSTVPLGADMGTLSYQWMRNGVNITDAIHNAYTLTADDVGMVINVMITAVNCDGMVCSTNQALVVNANQPNKPSAFSLSYTRKGTVYTVTIPKTAGAEYSFDGKIWGSQNIKTNCRPTQSIRGYKRLSAKLGYFPGNAVSASLKLPKLAQTTPASPKLESKTHVSVALRAVSGAEYSKDGRRWQGSRIFRGLRRNTVYRFYIRKRANSIYNVSKASRVLSVRTYRGLTTRPGVRYVPSSKWVRRYTTITLQAPRGYVLYYTINNTKPTTRSRRIISGRSIRVRISKATIVRVIAVRTYYAPSSEVKRIYRVR